jgi:hypothetical protein
MSERDAQDSLQIKVGEKLKLADESIVIVKDNPMDGIWLFCQYIVSPDATLIGLEQPVYGTDVVAFVNEENT